MAFVLTYSLLFLAGDIHIKSLEESLYSELHVKSKQRRKRRELYCYVGETQPSRQNRRRNKDN